MYPINTSRSQIWPNYHPWERSQIPRQAHVTKGHFGIQPRRATTVLSLLRKTFNQKIRGSAIF